MCRLLRRLDDVIGLSFNLHRLKHVCLFFRMSKELDGFVSHVGGVARKSRRARIFGLELLS